MKPAGPGERGHGCGHGRSRGRLHERLHGRLHQRLLGRSARLQRPFRGMRPSLLGVELVEPTLVLFHFILFSHLSCSLTLFAFFRSLFFQRDLRDEAGGALLVRRGRHLHGDAREPCTHNFFSSSLGYRCSFSVDFGLSFSFTFFLCFARF